MSDRSAEIIHNTQVYKGRLVPQSEPSGAAGVPQVCHLPTPGPIRMRIYLPSWILDYRHLKQSKICSRQKLTNVRGIKAKSEILYQTFY